MKTWYPSSKVQKMISRTPGTIRGYFPAQLLADATFKIAGPIASFFGMTGITFRKDCIVLSEEFCSSGNPGWQSAVIFHELVHVAQQKNMGMLAFKSIYVWEWIKSGFSYQKMKRIGLEKEAYDTEAAFVMGAR